MTHIDRWCFSSPIILGFSSWNQSWYVAFAFAVCAWLLTKLSRRNRSLFGRRFWGLNFGRRTGPYQIASTVPCLHSKGTKTCKKCPRFEVQKWTRFGGLFVLKKIMADPKTGPKNGSIFGPPKRWHFLHIFAPFDAIFCGVFRLPSATDVVFLHACWLKLAHGLCWSPVSSNSTAPRRHGTVVPTSC